MRAVHSESDTSGTSGNQPRRKSRRKGRRSKKGKDKAESVVASVASNNADGSVLQAISGLKESMGRSDKTVLAKLDQHKALIEQQNGRLDAIDERLKLVEKKQQKRPRSEVTCFSCGEKGHYNFECPSSAKNKDSKVRFNVDAPSFKPARPVARAEEDWEAEMLN